MTDQSGTTSYTYNAGGQLTTVTDGRGNTVSYAYDAAGRRKTMSSLMGTVQYAYDTAGRLVTLTSPDNKAIKYFYNLNGTLARYEYPNGSKTNWIYDDMDRPIRLKMEAFRDGYATTSSFNYGNYDNRGNIVQIQWYEDPTQYSSLRVRNHQLEYDRLSRLVKLSNIYRDSGYLAENLTTSYQYDEVGNRVLEFTAGSVWDDFTAGGSAAVYDASNRLLGVYLTGSKPVHYSYDQNGNQVEMREEKGLTTYNFDGENRLQRIVYPNGSKTEYYYTGDGLKVAKLEKNSQEFYIYDGNQIIAEIDGAGVVIRSYLRDLSGRLVSKTEQNKTSYYHQDVLGSTVLITNATGNITATYNYEPFGKVSGSAPDYGFAGARYESGPGLYQMGARYYNPAVGRFITQDTWRGDPYQPWTQNLYAYANNNPVNMVDPTGHAAVFIYAYMAALTSSPDLQMDAAMVMDDLASGSWGDAALGVVGLAIPSVPSQAIKVGAKKLFHKIGELVASSKGAGNAVKSYVPTVAELRAINPARSGLQTHHILPEYLGKQLGYTSAEMANHPGTLIPQFSHTGALNPDAFHKVISSYLKPGVAHTPEQIASGLEKAYTGLGRPELFNVIRDLIK